MTVHYTNHNYPVTVFTGKENLEIRRKDLLVAYGKKIVQEVEDIGLLPFKDVLIFANDNMKKEHRYSPAVLMRWVKELETVGAEDEEVAAEDYELIDLYNMYLRAGAKEKLGLVREIRKGQKNWQAKSYLTTTRFADDFAPKNRQEVDDKKSGSFEIMLPGGKRKVGAVIDADKKEAIENHDTYALEKALEEGITKDVSNADLKTDTRKKNIIVNMKDMFPDFDDDEDEDE